MIDHDGHTFERVAIERWVRDHHRCPFAHPLELHNLVPNRALRDAIEGWSGAHPNHPDLPANYPISTLIVLGNDLCGCNVV